MAVGVEALYFAGDDYTLYLDGRNNAVLAGDDTAATVQDDTVSITAATLLANDTDFDGDALSIVAVDDSATAGTVTQTAGGDIDYATGDAFDFLGAGETATDSFVYTASDGNGGDTTATVTVTVTGVNDAATFGGDLSGAATEDSGIVVTGTATVADVDQGQGSIVASSGNTAYGSYSIGTDGVWTYALDDTNPTVDALGSGDPLTDSFIFTSDDGTEQTIDIAITGADDGPAAPAYIDLNSGTSFTGVTGVAKNFVIDFGTFPITSLSVDIANFTIGEDRMVFINFGSGGQTYANFITNSSGILEASDADGALRFTDWFNTVAEINFSDASGGQEDGAFLDSLINSGDFDATANAGVVPVETVALDDLASDDLFVFYANDLILA